MKITDGRISSSTVEEKQKTQLTNDNTVTTKQRLAELDRKIISPVFGGVDDTVELSTSKEISQSDEARTARVAELKKLYSQNNLKYDSGVVAKSLVSAIDEEIDFGRLLGLNNSKE